MNDNKIFKIILKDLQKLNEKKTVKPDFLDLDGDGDKKEPMKKAAKDKKKKESLKEEDGTIVCGACRHKNIVDKSPSELKICQNPDCDEPIDNLDEKRKRKKRKKTKSRKKKQVKHDPNYDAPEGSKRDKALDRARRAYQRGDVAAAARIRRNMEKKERSKKGYKNIKRSDTGIYTESLQINELNELINDMVEEQLLDEMLNDLEKHLDEKRKRKKKKKKKGGGLSAAVKKSLDKKADRRCLTRGSVYSEFRKGLAAYLSSGSRKGMSAHQWAHARVNSANPSKSWATVKKRKTCPKKKKK
jgi:hypothetical protein